MLHELSFMIDDVSEIVSIVCVAFISFFCGIAFSVVCDRCKQDHRKKKNSDHGKTH